jgi:hypothetical protein
VTCHVNADCPAATPSCCIIAGSGYPGVCAAAPCR